MESVYLAAKSKLFLLQEHFTKTRVLIFDEPTSAMDANNSLLIKNLILKLKNNKTIILITHDRTLFADLFDMELKIDRGKLVS